MIFVCEEEEEEEEEDSSSLKGNGDCRCWSNGTRMKEKEKKYQEEGREQATTIITSRAANRTKDTRATNFDLKEPIK